MKKHILTLFTISSLFVIAGCASDPASVNANAGITETLNENEIAEVVVANANDNANENSNTNVEENTNVVGNTTDTDIDTSDWLTYTNEEYGFSFRYPSTWGTVEEKEGLVSGIGSKHYLTFSKDINKGVENTEDLPQINITSSDYFKKHGGDVPEEVDMNKINLEESESDLEKYFLNSSVDRADVEKITADGIIIFRVYEDGKSMAGEYSNNLKYYIPYAQQSGSYNLLVLSSGTDTQIMNAIVNSMIF